MRLTSFSDYALRVLLYAAAQPNTRLTIEGAAEYYNISRAHLKKVVLKLTQEGFLIGHRGRMGGFTLARPADQINLGAVLRATEPDFALFECFQTHNECCITRRCGLPSIASEALRAFLAVFERHSLADFMIAPDMFQNPAPTGPQPKRGPHLTAA